MISYSKGGWTWDDLYNNIPIYLREFYFKEMNNIAEKEREITEKVKSEMKSQSKRRK